jgi:hypothetical protein
MASERAHVYRGTRTDTGATRDHPAAHRDRDRDLDPDRDAAPDPDRDRDPDPDPDPQDMSNHVAVRQSEAAALAGVGPQRLCRWGGAAGAPGNQSLFIPSPRIFL